MAHPPADGFHHFMPMSFWRKCESSGDFKGGGCLARNVSAAPQGVLTKVNDLGLNSGQAAALKCWPIVAGATAAFGTSTVTSGPGSC